MKKKLIEKNTFLPDEKKKKKKKNEDGYDVCGSCYGKLADSPYVKVVSANLVMFHYLRNVLVLREKN